MTRQARQERDPHQHKNFSKMPGIQRERGHKGFLPIMKSARGDTAQGPKAKETVSVAGIFKKRKEINKAKNQRKQRSPSSEETLEVALTILHKDGLEEAREVISANLTLSFEDIHSHLLQKLSEFRSNDEAFLTRISSSTNALGAPLSEELIKTTFKRDGAHVTEVVQIGQRLALFKKSIEKDTAKLTEYWAQWEEMQHGFVELGLEIFGNEAFPDVDEDDKDGAKKGYSRDMELLNLEYEARMEELVEEIENVKDKALEQTRASEKDLDNMLKNVKGRVMEAFMAD